MLSVHIRMLSNLLATYNVFVYFFITLNFNDMCYKHHFFLVYSHVLRKDYKLLAIDLASI